MLFLLDEFASLGPMDVLKDSLASLAGFGVRICTIVQGLGQLDDLYGRPGREAILQNSALQVLFAANDDTTARYLSSGSAPRRSRRCRAAFPPEDGSPRRPTDGRGVRSCCPKRCASSGGRARLQRRGTRRPRRQDPLPRGAETPGTPASRRSVERRQVQGAQRNIAEHRDPEADAEERERAQIDRGELGPARPEAFIGEGYQCLVNKCMSRAPPGSDESSRHRRRHA